MQGVLDKLHPYFFFFSIPDITLNDCFFLLRQFCRSTMTDDIGVFEKWIVFSASGEKPFFDLFKDERIDKRCTSDCNTITVCLFRKNRKTLKAIDIAVCNNFHIRVIFLEPDQWIIECGFFIWIADRSGMDIDFPDTVCRKDPKISLDLHLFVLDTDPDLCTGSFVSASDCL